MHLCNIQVQLDSPNHIALALWYTQLADIVIGSQWRLGLPLFMEKQIKARWLQCTVGQRVRIGLELIDVVLVELLNVETAVKSGLGLGYFDVVDALLGLGLGLGEKFYNVNDLG